MFYIRDGLLISDNDLVENLKASRSEWSTASMLCVANSSPLLSSKRRSVCAQEPVPVMGALLWCDSCSRTDDEEAELMKC